MLREPIWERARGRWPGILAAIGVPAKALRNKHGPCPVCGGKDQFRFDDKSGEGTFICSQCGPGTGVKLVQLLKGCDFKTAAQEIEKHIGAAEVMPTDKGQRQDDQQKRDQMTALWKRAKAITLNDPAGRFLNMRTGIVTFPANLRQVADERYIEDGARPTWHPAMIARVDPSDQARASGERAAIQRTYLNADGGKADVGSPRRMLGAMPTGAAVRLMPHENILGIAEGIETAIAASIMFGVPVWAALTADLLQAWEPPACVETVMVFGDNDHSLTGQAAAFSLGRRLKAKRLTVMVELPQRMGSDWNDVLLERRRPA